MNFRLLPILGFIFIGFSSFGQTNLSAQEAIFDALENNYQIIISEKQLEISEKNNSWSEAGAFPTVTLSVGNNNTIQDNTNNPFTFTPGLILSQSLTPSIGANWNIFSGFAVRMSKQRLEQVVEQSANNLTVVIESTIQEVLKAYYSAQLQKERKELFKSILSHSRSRYEYISLKAKYSTSNSLELLQFSNQYLTDSINLLMQDISYKNAIRNLKLVMNDSSNVVYNLTDKLELAINEINIEKAEEELFKNNRNLQNQFISLELQKTNTSFRRSFLYPTLSFQTGVNPNWSQLRDLNDDQLNITTNTVSYYGNLNLNYTLFNNWKNKRAVEVSKIQEEIASLNIDEMKKQLSYTLENLIELFHARTQLAEISYQNILYAEKAFEMAETQFDKNLINSIDLTSFQNSYETAMIQHYENLFNKLDTYLEIYKMMGKISLEYKGEE